MFLEQQILIKSNFPITGTNYILKLKGSYYALFQSLFGITNSFYKDFAFGCTIICFHACLLKKALFVTYFTLLQHFSVRQQHYTITKVEKAERHNRTPLNKTIYNMIIFYCISGKKIKIKCVFFLH